MVVGDARGTRLNTKHHPEKTVWVSGDVYSVTGQPWPYLNAAISEGEKASRRLTAACSFNVRVHPVIVVVGSADLQIPQQPPDVRVVGCDDVVEWFREPPAGPDHEARGGHCRQPALHAASFPRPPRADVAPRPVVSSRSDPVPVAPRHDAVWSRRGRRCAGSHHRGVRAAVPFVTPSVVGPVSSTGATPAASSATPTTASPNFQAVGTVTNGQCVDAWSDHDVEVLISGAQAGSDCTRFAAPSYTATLAPGGFLTSSIRTLWTLDPRRRS